MRHNIKGQSILEYVTVVSLVIAALVIMHTYIKRGLQAAIKVATDELALQAGSEEAVNIAKGGILVKEDSYFEQSRTGYANQLYTDRSRNVFDSVNGFSNSVSLQAKMPGDFHQD